MSPRLTKIAVMAAALVASGGIGLWTASVGFAQETGPVPVRTEPDRSGSRVVRTGDGPIVVNPPDDRPPVVPPGPGPVTESPNASCPTCANPSVAPTLAPAGH